MERADAAAAESRKRKREEYEMQLFGFHTRAVYATLRNIIMSRIQSKTRKLGEALEQCNTDPESLDAIKINEAQLLKAYQAASSPHLKTIENIVNKFISVPGNVLADEDKLQGTQYTEAELENIRKKLDEFQQRARRATILNAALKEELQLVEQFSICADNTDKLSRIIESDIAYQDVSEKIPRVIKNYKQFNASLDDAARVSQRVLYNTMDDFERVDCDIDNL
ncbi:hypothetical protein DMN91_003606 [Ooceraea biroi]|uniref:Protein MIS12 homolog n=1 Tax=Ooceraea biroi TaxID=2015173 RepID=A0A026W6P1_OOCBI|nr:uncharacterized protein LOC105282510 isoform X2 [Ooceraea biroi]EZA51725.1 hypothetical protein X777_09481 [Ooceraea biroi]RLU23402.1 hypothetical protein DMN91_003606 [Ooceraea biroi]